MANAFTKQVLVDGPRNTVIKVEGILDTSDLAASGTIGSSGVITANSAVVTFTAGALTPVVGQFVTSSGGTGTLATGSYIISVDSATQITLSAPATASGTGATISGTAGAVVLIDPSKLSYLDNAKETTPTRLSIRKITHNIEDTLSCNLFWYATTPVRIEQLLGREERDYEKFGGLYNNAGTGVDGKITLSTSGWAASAVLSFSLIVELVKS